jgi:hypothetical protein
MEDTDWPYKDFLESFQSSVFSVQCGDQADLVECLPPVIFVTADNDNRQLLLALPAPSPMKRIEQVSDRAPISSPCP